MHGMHHIRIAQRGGRQQAVGSSWRRAAGQRRPRGEIVGHRQAQQCQRRPQRDQAEQRVEEEGHRDEDRRPGRIEERRHGRGADEVAHLLQVVQAGADIRPSGPRRRQGRIEQIGAHGIVPPAAEPRRRDAPQPVEHAQHQHAHGGDQREIQERLDPVGEQHPVEDLEHVDRRDQDQEVDRTTQQRDQPDAIGCLAQHPLGRPDRERGRNHRRLTPG
jgi:hypothetical protein